MKKIVPSASVFIPDKAERVFAGQIFDVYHWQQQMFDGSDATFEMLRRPDTVVAICVVDDKILVIDDEQPHTGSKKSFPSGRVDETDISIQAAAEREVREETGYGFHNWRLVRVWQPHSKIEWFVHLWLAWDVTDKIAPKLDAGEKITVEAVDFSETKNLVLNKTGYLKNAIEIFETIHSLTELLDLPEYSGETVNR